MYVVHRLHENCPYAHPKGIRRNSDAGFSSLAGCISYLYQLLKLGNSENLGSIVMLQIC